MKDKLQAVLEGAKLYYDKLLLGFSLLLLIAVLVFAMVTRTGHRETITQAREEFRPPKTLVEAYGEKTFAFNVAYPKGDLWAQDFTDHNNQPDGGFGQPGYFVYPLDDDPHILHRSTKLNPWTGENAENTEVDEPEDEREDTDAGGLPDEVEEQFDLNIQDPADDTGDIDGDGFTNLEEHRAKTAMDDPGSHGLLASKGILRLTGAKADRLPFLLKKVSKAGYSDQDKDKWDIQFVGKIPKGWASIKIGQMIPRTPYRLVDAAFKQIADPRNPGIFKEASTATVKREGSDQPIICELNRPVIGPNKILRLNVYYGRDVSSVIVREHETFSIKDLAGNEEQYRLTPEGAGGRVTYYAESGNERFEIRPIGKEEHTQLRQKLLNPPAAVQPGWPSVPDQLPVPGLPKSRR